MSYNPHINRHAQLSYKLEYFHFHLHCIDLFIFGFTDIYLLVLVQDDWDPDWQSTSSSKVTYLVRRLKALQEANSKVDCPTNDKNCSMDTENLPSLPHMGDSKELIQVHGFRMSSKTHETNLEKVLVFSQFLEHIHVIEQQVTIVYYTISWLYVIIFVQVMDSYTILFPVDHCWY